MDILFLCIGTEKISGDALGPIVGTMLREKYKLPYPVLGTEENPINGKNVGEYKRLIKERFPNHKVIAIDSAVGEEKDLWTIKIKEGGVRAGGALSPENEYFGEIGILAVVAQKGNVLQNLMLSPYPKVLALAERIALMIVKVFASVKNLSNF